MSLSSEADQQAIARATISRGISGEDRYWLITHGIESQIQAAKTILDGGSGEGHFGRFLRSDLGLKGRLIGTDIHRYGGVSEEVYNRSHG